MNRSAAVRREIPASRHIPYAAHVAPEVVTTAAGDYAQTLRLAGTSFETTDDETLNNWHERLNVTWRNIASPNISLWAHLIRHVTFRGYRLRGASGSPIGSQSATRSDSRPRRSW